LKIIDVRNTDTKEKHKWLKLAGTQHFSATDEKKPAEILADETNSKQEKSKKFQRVQIPVL
jgi:hypothetical protein